MSNSINYTFSSPANSSITITIASMATNVTTNDGQTYQGYAITGISGTFNGYTITGMAGTGGSSQSNGNGSYDNTIFINNSQGDGGSSLDGIDDEGIAFIANGNAYNVYTSGGSFAYVYQGNNNPATLQSTNEPQVVCFGPATLIRTPTGDVAVEGLSVGDLVTTAGGKVRPVTWIGHRTVHCARYPQPSDVWPVRIAAGAFGDNRPARDLLLSPGHAVCVDLLGEVLIPAEHLVNGATITREPVDRITYWHVELETHDVLLAENLPAESYLDVGNRHFFEGGAVTALTAPVDPPSLDRSEAGFCLPTYSHGPMLDVVRQQLRRRAAALGWTLDRDPIGELCLMVDGRRVEAALQGMTARFTVPAAARDVRLVCRPSRPRDVGTGDDARRLGVCLAALHVEDAAMSREVALDDPLLAAGFHDVEEGVRRWTDGSAPLDPHFWAGCTQGFVLRLDLACPAVPRWIAPPAAEDELCKAA